jgi:hypothetical protein
LPRLRSLALRLPVPGQPSHFLNSREQRLIYLDSAELRKLTGYCRRSKQRAELERQRIPYRVNAKGEIVVRRDHAEPEVAEPELGPVR